MAEVRLVRSREPIMEASRMLRDAFEAIHDRQSFVRMAIPGGSALAAFGEFRRILEAGVWRHARLTWVDERLVPFEHPDSNRGEAYRRGFLSHEDTPETELPLFLDGESPEEACRRVSDGFHADFHDELDVVLLGMGEDGHIASLFPGHSWLPAPVKVQPVMDSPKPPPERLSLTLDFLKTAPEILLLAAGSAKADALRRLLREDPDLPASHLPRLTIVTDIQV